MAEKQPLLSLDTLVERDHIKIDGKAYEMVNAGELSLLESHRLRKLGAEIQRIFDKANPSEAELTRLEKSTATTLQTVVPGIPKAVRDKLSHSQRWGIVMVFIMRSRPASATQDKGKARPARKRAPSRKTSASR